MSSADVTISCPHCHRTYTMKIDPERLTRLKTRATCGRCGNTFDAASRIVPASEATTDPKLPRLDVPPVAQLVPTTASPIATIPDLNDEMEELAREFAEAAARFTPVAVKRPAAVLAPAAAAPPAASPSSTQPDLHPPTIEEPPPPVIVAAPASVAAPADADPSESDVAAAYDQLSLEAAPAAADELAAPDDLAAAAELAVTVPTQSRRRPTPPTPPTPPAPPRDWLERADPGLASLQAPPSAGAAALEALLNESERIALPAASS